MMNVASVALAASIIVPSALSWPECNLVVWLYEPGSYGWTCEPDVRSGKSGGPIPESLAG
jgi:hypothetical protein